MSLNGLTFSFFFNPPSTPPLGLHLFQFLHMAMALVLPLGQCGRLLPQRSAIRAGTADNFYYHIPESCSIASVV